MGIRSRALGLTLLAGMFVGAPAIAHHSPSKYETGKSVQIVGAVTKYEWANPHVYIYLEQTDETGKKVTWEIEGGPPFMMRRMGWSLETLHVGDILTVSGAPAKNPNDKSMIAGSIKKANTSLFDFASLQKQFMSADTKKFAAKGLDGVWLALPTMQIILESAFPDKAKLTPYGVQTLGAFDENTSPAASCIAQAPPLSMLMPDLKRITIGKEVIEFRAEGEESVRKIHMNVSTHDGAIPSHLGHSIGRWEGQTLLIDTVHFAYHALGNGYGVPSSPKKRLIERLSLNPDGVSLNYSFEMSDPDYLVAPRKGSVRWAFRPDEKLVNDKCDLDNAKRFIR